MKITKTNYNELRTQELDNNYAKVWHVNEIREELLANTGSGGVTELTTDETLTGSIAFQTNKSNITATANTNDNSITFNYTVPYQEIIFIVLVDNASVIPIYSSVEGLEYTNAGVGNNTRLYSNLAFTCDEISVQLTVNKSLGTGTYIEIPYVISTNINGEIIISVDHSSDGTDFDGKGIKSSLYVNIKFFNFVLAQP